MRISKTVVATGLAAALLLAGCSVSRESSSTVTTEVTADGTTETNSVEVSTSVGTDGVSADVSATSDTVINIDSWEYGWVGTSTAGSTVFYAESPDAEQGLIVVKDDNYDGLIACIGTLAKDEDGISSVTDLVSGSTFRFELLGQDGDIVTLDLGDEFGTVDLTWYEMPDFLAELIAADPEGQVVAR